MPFHVLTSTALNHLFNQVPLGHGLSRKDCIHSFCQGIRTQVFPILILIILRSRKLTLNLLHLGHLPAKLLHRIFCLEKFQKFFLRHIQIMSIAFENMHRRSCNSGIVQAIENIRFKINIKNPVSSVSGAVFIDNILLHLLSQTTHEENSSFPVAYRRWCQDADLVGFPV